MYDRERKLVLDAMPERTEENLLSFYRSWKPARLEAINLENAVELMNPPDGLFCLFFYLSFLATHLVP